MLNLHGYLQRAEREWREKYYLKHRMYLIAKEAELKVAIAFAYSNGLKIGPKADDEIEGKNSPVALELYITGAKSADDRKVQASVTPDVN